MLVVEPGHPLVELDRLPLVMSHNEPVLVVVGGGVPVEAEFGASGMALVTAHVQW